jgi:hypothetical protein
MNTKDLRLERPMDFIERLLRMTPDGGSGAYELFLALVPFLAMAVRGFTKRNRSNTERRASTCIR